MISAARNKIAPLRGSRSWPNVREAGLAKNRNESSECHGSQTCNDPYQQRERPQDCRPNRSRRRCCAVTSQNNLPKYRLDGSNTVLSFCISPECNIRLDDNP
jgi:hypothetical protein